MKYDNFMKTSLGGYHLNGFKYILEILNSDEKMTYENIGKKYNITKQAVEIAIRNYIRYIVSIHSITFLKYLFGYQINKNQKISNKKFITLVRDNIDNNIYNKYMLLAAELKAADLDLNGKWINICNKYDESRIKTYKEYRQNNDCLTFGDLKWYDNQIYKYISYREALRLISIEDINKFQNKYITIEK